MSILYLTVIMSLFAPTTAIETKGDVTTKEKWIIISKFTLKSNEFHFNYNVSYPKTLHNINLLFYDESQCKQLVGGKSLNQAHTCDAKHNLASKQHGHLIEMPGDGHNCVEYGEKSDRSHKWLRCASSATLKETSNKSWCIAVDNCKASKGLKFRFRISSAAH